MNIQNKEILINERDDYYYDAFGWAVIAAVCLYFGWEPCSLFAAGLGVLELLVGIGVSIWISRK